MSIRGSSIVMLLMLAVTAWCIPIALGCTQQTDCELYFYCEDSNNRCIDCEMLCEKEELKCIKKCPDYVFKSLRERLTKMENSATAANVIVSILIGLNVVLVLLLAFANRNKIVQLCRWRPQSNKEQTPVGYTHENPNTQSPRAVPRNGANGRNGVRPVSTAVSLYPETEADNSVQTGTTSISNRHPAEDSTESYSYDNAACNVSPDRQQRY